MGQHTTDSILYALFCLSRDTRHIDAGELARAAGLSTTDAARALLVLERDGLVDATRARLTMLGLARASQLGASGQGGPRIDLRASQPRKPTRALPIAARSDLPPAADRREREDHHPYYDDHAALRIDGPPLLSHAVPGGAAQEL